MPATGPQPARIAVTGLAAALTLVLSACGSDDSAPAPELPVQPPIAVPVPPDPTPPSPSPVDPDPSAPTPEAEATRVSLLAAARAGDWDAVGALIPAEGFTASFGGETDAVAYYRALPEDMLAVIVRLLEGPSARFSPDLGLTVWPDLHARDPFVIADDERADLAAVYGAEALRGWEAVGSYLGWRIGIDDDGTWRFLVAGD